MEHFSKLLLVRHVKVRASSLRADFHVEKLVAALHASVLAPILVGAPVIHAHLHV